MTHADVTLNYRPALPSHYVARLGTGGWLEGYGWSEDQALLELAEAICVADDAPPGIPGELLGDIDRLIGLLRGAAGTPILDD